MATRVEAATLLALVQATRAPWHKVADVVEKAGSAAAAAAGDVQTDDPGDIAVLNEVRTLTGKLDTARWEEALEDLAATDPDVQLVTVLDSKYPRNLRLVYNRPPFLFIRGRLEASDDLAVAIVGTRDASEDGRREADLLAGALSAEGVTILSGLAQGIDASAHQAAMRAGGRTVAVMGTGIRRVYPRGHDGLAEHIVRSGGALVSQFWPDSPPMASNFPLRNVVMSGMGIGTVVVEASSTSGAKMQARLALEHGKRLFLLESLVLHQEWARQYASRPGAVVVKRASDVLEILTKSQSPDHLLQIA